MESCNITSKSVGNKIYDKNKKLLGKIDDIIIKKGKGVYLEIEVEGCSPDEKCLLSIEHIHGCGDYGYETDIDRDFLSCRRKNRNASVAQQGEHPK